eukprot:scaffold66030_cov53-Phaeocystis_antarctica.AAC.2
MKPALSSSSRGGRSMAHIRRRAWMASLRPTARSAISPSSRTGTSPASTRRCCASPTQPLGRIRPVDRSPIHASQPSGPKDADYLTRRRLAHGALPRACRVRIALPVADGGEDQEQRNSNNGRKEHQPYRPLRAVLALLRAIIEVGALLHAAEAERALVSWSAVGTTTQAIFLRMAKVAADARAELVDVVVKQLQLLIFARKLRFRCRFGDTLSAFARVERAVRQPPVAGP